MVKKLKRILQRMLGFGPLRKVVRTINTVVFGLVSSTRITSVIYSWFAFLPFGREQHAYTRAKYHYYKNLNRNTLTKVTLRRNTHRLEKGLIMQPRKDLFATDYIGETVDLYIKRVQFYNEDHANVDVTLVSVLRFKFL